MLPQGMFSVAVATVLFPALSRLAARRDAAAMRRAVGIGMRQINLLLIPAAAFMIVLATPIVRLRLRTWRSSTPSRRTWSPKRCSGSPSACRSAGINLLLTRTFFALQRPWIPTRLAAMNIVVDIIVSVGLYKPLGIAGLVIGTVAANAVMAGAAAAPPADRLQRPPGRRPDDDDHRPDRGRLRLLAGVSWVVWYALDAVLGKSLPAQIVSMGAAGVAGVWIYTRAVLTMRIPEAHQVNRMIRARLGRA